MTLILIKCHNSVHSEVVKKYPNGDTLKVQYYYQKGENKEIVKEIEYYENGNKKFEGEYKNEKKFPVMISNNPANSSELRITAFSTLLLVIEKRSYLSSTIPWYAGPPDRLPVECCRIFTCHGASPCLILTTIIAYPTVADKELIIFLQK